MYKKLLKIENKLTFYQLQIYQCKQIEYPTMI